MLLILKVPAAPTWNIALLWISAVLIIVRMAYAVLQMDRPVQPSESLIMGSITILALAWAVTWTWYFLVAERVARVFTA